MKHIANCSFGKDSIAAIIARLEHNEPVDELLYCRIMFDDNISAEVPLHEDFIHNKAIQLMQSRYGLKTTIVQGKKSYCDQFYQVKQKGSRAGQCYGFPYSKGAWCNDRLKVIPLNSWKKTQGEHKTIVGIAADEPKRIAGALKNGLILPLVDYNISEKEAFEICRKHDLLSPAYAEGRFRLGCWFCHNQRVGDMRLLRNNYNDLWQRLLELDKDTPEKTVFRRDGKSVHDYDQKFKNENNLASKQLTVFDLKGR